MMNSITRRKFLVNAAGSIAAARLYSQSGPAAQVALKIPAEIGTTHMPMDFGGLSYELRQLSDPDFFSGSNSGLIEAFKSLTFRGVLRLGGNTSEFAWWKSSPDAVEPPHPQTREVAGEPKAEFYAITPQAVQNLAGFLKATGWKCIYGINMGTNSPERATAEAEFVAKTLGENLEYFQIGNEVDLFDRHLRDPRSWNAGQYLDEWLMLARAITVKVPNAKFGMPDVASNISWLTEIGERWSSIPNPPHVITLSHHYYFGGPATNPDVSIPNLLKSATMSKVQATADQAASAAKKMGVRVRMTEGNTCYRGGKPGVSDVFGSALWAADYALLLASNNYSGINLHGGTGQSVAISVGGFLPGDVMLKDAGATAEQIATHPHPFYTPIATFGPQYALQPVGLGLKLALNLCGGSFIPADFTSQIQSEGINATGYAARFEDGGIAVMLLNKDSDRDLGVRLDFGKTAHGSLRAQKLTGAALDGREAYLTRPELAGEIQDGSYTLVVPRNSGICLKTL